MKTLNTGVQVTQLEKQKSYHNGNKQKVTRIEVYSELYEFDTIYQDITLDSEYKLWQENQLKKLLQ